MNFFKSVFSDEPEPPRSDPGSSIIDQGRGSESSDSDPDSPTKQHESYPDRESESESEPESSGGWSFGGLMRTLTVKSESVIETYRRDLQEFGSGLKKEIEVAQGSLETVSQAIDEIGSTVIKGTAQIISHGKEVILAADLESESSDSNNYGSSQNQSFNSKRYSRFDAQVRAIQGDVSTYCEEPEDLSDYSKWKLGFVLEEKGEEIESLFEENGAMESIYKRVVPGSVDHQTFWCRYFYKVHKLKQTEDFRVKLVNRAISTEEEELSWDVDDSDDEKEKEKHNKNHSGMKENREMGSETSDDSFKDDEKSQVAIQNMEGASTDVQGTNVVPKGGPLEKADLVGKDSDQPTKKDSVDGELKIESAKVDDKGENIASEDIVGKVAGESRRKGDDDDEKAHLEKSSGGNKEEAESKPEEKVVVSEIKPDHGRESSKGSDYSVVSSQPSLPEEEDLGWDEIEDLSSIDDDKRPTQSGSPNRVDLRKRLSVAEEEEDLSWDIEEDDDDDDEPVKA